MARYRPSVTIFQRFSPSVFFTLLLLALAGCDKAPAHDEEKATDAAVSREAVATPQGKPVEADRHVEVDELPILDSDSITHSLPWLVEVLKLRDRPNADFQISSSEISPDRRYAIVNISDGKESGSSGPFYRFVVVNPKARRIFYPPMSELESESFGYPYIAAKFHENNLLAVAYGYRSIEASVVSLPEGKVIAREALEVVESEEIKARLASLLKAHEIVGGPAMQTPGKAGDAKLCESLKTRMKARHQEIIAFHNMAMASESVFNSGYTVLPRDFVLDADEKRSSACVEELGPDECDGSSMQTVSYLNDRILHDVVAGWDLTFMDDFGRLSSGVYQGMSQEALIKIIGKPYRRSESVLSYHVTTEYVDDDSHTEELFFYFKEGKLFAIRNSNGSGC